MTAPDLFCLVATSCLDVCLFEIYLFRSVLRIIPELELASSRSGHPQLIRSRSALLYCCPGLSIRQSWRGSSLESLIRPSVSPKIRRDRFPGRNADSMASKWIAADLTACPYSIVECIFTCYFDVNTYLWFKCVSKESQGHVTVSMHAGMCCDCASSDLQQEM